MVTSRDSHPSRIVASAVRLAIAALALSVAAGCAPRAPEERLPEGELFVARAAGLGAWLDPLREIQESRLLTVVERGTAAIAGCDEIEAFCAGSEECDLLDRLGCRQPGSEAAVAWELLSEADWLFSRVRDGRRWSLVGRQGAGGGLEIEVDLPPLAHPGPMSLLMPAKEGPGVARLGGAGLLMHLRFRPAAGLDVASLMPAEEMGARLFQLKSDLFLAAVLSGNWELAVHAPETGARFPPMSLALDFRTRGPAIAAMERLLDNLTGVWPVRRDPYELRGWAGECLGNLNVLPELAPCFVATGDALVLGWNRMSLELALSSTPGALDPESSGGVLYLASFPEADQRLAGAYGSEDDRQLVYPWSRARISGRQVGERFVIRVELMPGGSS